MKMLLIRVMYDCYPNNSDNRWKLCNPTLEEYDLFVMEQEKEEERGRDTTRRRERHRPQIAPFVEEDPPVVLCVVAPFLCGLGLRRRSRSPQELFLRLVHPESQQSPSADAVTRACTNHCVANDQPAFFPWDEVNITC